MLDCVKASIVKFFQHNEGSVHGNIQKTELNNTVKSFLFNVDIEMRRIIELKKIAAPLTENQLKGVFEEPGEMFGVHSNYERTVEWRVDTLETILEKAKRLETLSNLVVFCNTFKELYYLLKDFINRLEDLVHMAMIDKFSTKYSNTTGLWFMFNDLVSKAIDLNTKLVINKPTDLYKSDVTMKLEKSGKLSIFLHVPVATFRTVAPIYRLMNHPIDFGHPSYVAYIDIRDKVFIAPFEQLWHREKPSITEDNQATFLETTETELSKCKVYNSVYICDMRKSRFLYLQDRLGLCVRALLRYEIIEASKYCRYSFSRNTDTMFRINKNEYLVHSTATKRIEEKCDGFFSRSGVIFKGLNYIVGYDGCHIDVFDFETRIVPSGIIYKDHNLPVLNIFEFMGLNVTREELDVAINILDTMGYEIVYQKDISLLMSSYERINKLEQKMQERV
jgi:hypothetical protein